MLLSRWQFGATVTYHFLFVPVYQGERPGRQGGSALTRKPCRAGTGSEPEYRLVRSTADDVQTSPGLQGQRARSVKTRCFLDPSRPTSSDLLVRRACDNELM